MKSRNSLNEVLINSGQRFLSDVLTKLASLSGLHHTLRSINFVLKEQPLACADEQECAQIKGLLKVSLPHLVALSEVISPNEVGTRVGGDDSRALLGQGEDSSDEVDDPVVCVDVFLLHL